MSTLFDEALALARKVAVIYGGSATANGTTTTLKDATNRLEADDFWNLGTIFMTGGDNLGQSRAVTDFVASTDTLTFVAMPEAIQSGDTYALINADFPKAMLLEAINGALKTWDAGERRDETLEIDADVYEYVLPAGVTKVLQVWISTTTTEPYNWKRFHQWNQDGEYLRLHAILYPEGCPIRLVHQVAVEDLTEDEDEIDPKVNLEGLRWLATINLCRQGLRMYKTDDKRGLEQLMEEAQQMYKGFVHQVPIARRDPVHASWV